MLILVLCQQYTVSCHELEAADLTQCTDQTLRRSLGPNAVADVSVTTRLLFLPANSGVHDQHSAWTQRLLFSTGRYATK